MENLIKDYFKDKELTIENVIEMCETDYRLRMKINRDVDKEWHKEDIIDELTAREIEFTDADVECILDRFEDYLSESDEWRIALDCAIDWWED